MEYALNLIFLSIQNLLICPRINHFDLVCVKKPQALLIEPVFAPSTAIFYFNLSKMAPLNFRPVFFQLPEEIKIIWKEKVLNPGLPASQGTALTTGPRLLRQR